MGFVQMSSRGSICVEASQILKIFPVLMALGSFLLLEDVQEIVIFINGSITFFYLRIYYYRISAGGYQVTYGIKTLFKRRVLNILLLLLIPYSIRAQIVIVVLVYMLYYIELLKIPVEKTKPWGVVNFKFWQSDILQSLNNSLLGLLFNWNLISESNFFVLRMWTSASQVSRAMAELKLRSSIHIGQLWKELTIFTPILLVGLVVVTRPIGGIVTDYFSALSVDMSPYVLPLGLLFFYDAYRHVIVTDLQRDEKMIGVVIWLEVILVVFTVLFASISGRDILFVYLLSILALFVPIMKFINGKY